MSFDPKALMDEVVADFEAALKAAYEQGVQDGIDRIVQAARAPMTLSTSKAVALGYANPGREGDAELGGQITTRAPERIAKHIARRAPRGLVPKIVGNMLRDKPGKIIAEYEQMVTLYDGRVSEKSVGNELRRHEGKKYRRNENGEWFPMSGNKEAEDAATNEQSSASDTQTQGERYGTALDL